MHSCMMLASYITLSRKVANVQEDANHVSLLLLLCSYFIYLFIINFFQRLGSHKRHKPVQGASPQRLHTNIYNLHIQE